MRDVIENIQRSPLNQSKELGETAKFECGGINNYVTSWEFVPTNKTSFEKVQAIQADVQPDKENNGKKRIDMEFASRKRAPKNWNWYEITDAVFYMTYLLLYHKFGNMVIFRS